MPECIWAADAEGKVNYWNRPGLAYCGLRPADVHEESFWECLHPDDRSDARAHWEAGLRSGAPFDRQVRIKRAADGSYRWHVARAVPEREPDGTIVGWIATATDIDDQKRAEEALRKAIILRDDFLSVASHELRTPLTSLKLEVANLSRIARRDGGSSGAPRLIAKVEKIDSQAARLHRLIDELLDVSRIAAGRLELHVEAVDLAQIVNEVGTRFSDEAARVGSTLNIHAPASVVGRWDKSRLDQVVTNLVSNAIKYGDCKPIDVTLEAEDDRAVVTIRDRGLGIAPNDHERIFGRFERAASTRHYGGIGLGLWIVKQIIDALGGTVTVESTPGTGSTFTVELPRSADKTRHPTAGGGLERLLATGAQPAQLSSPLARPSIASPVACLGAGYRLAPWGPCATSAGASAPRRACQETSVLRGDASPASFARQTTSSARTTRLSSLLAPCRSETRAEGTLSVQLTLPSAPRLTL